MSGKSPLAPKNFPAIPVVAGVRLAAIAAGERYTGRDDLLLAEFSEGTKVAGVLTRSQIPGAAVKWCRQLLPQGRARGLVVNAGNANVFTGRSGHAAVGRTARAAAKLLGPPKRPTRRAASARPQPRRKGRRRRQPPREPFPVRLGCSPRSS